MGENVTKASNSVHKAASGVGCIHCPRPDVSSIVRPGQGQSVPWFWSPKLNDNGINCVTIALILFVAKEANAIVRK